MSSMEVYNRLRESILKALPRYDEDSINVVIQMGICSQAAGAVEVVKALEETIFHRGIRNVVITKTGCAGFCAYEPMVTIRRKGLKPVTYCRVTPEKARILLSEYVLKKRIIKSWTLMGEDVML
ncbi:MAG: (2Fe-2S) ferredoxin domain-containing protein [Clostridiales bacterium]|nr:(2Fe-2S) ferredoxin domain-containing protein [Clostridiales bacterium]